MSPQSIIWSARIMRKWHVEAADDEGVHPLAVCRLADRRLTEGFEATSLPTLVQMVDNGLGTTLLPRLAVDAGLLQGTNLVTRPLLSHEAARKIGLVWRRGTGRCSRRSSWYAPS
jgi:DNA-binding transcriptional LysR family regulator